MNDVATGTRVESPTLEEGTSFALDVLRAVTAQAVVVGHAMSFFGVLPRLQPPYVPAIQEVGVLIFFVLSGFLIAFTTWTKRQRGSRYGFRDYFVERFARIYSGYVPALAFIFAVDTARVRLRPEGYLHEGTLDAKTLVGNLLMLEDFPLLGPIHRRVSVIPTIDRLGSGRPLWTLAIEWWIYLLFGWAVLAQGVRKKSPVLFWSVLALFAVVPAFNSVAGFGEGIAAAWGYGAIGCALLWRGIDAVPKRTLWGGALALTVLALARAALAHGKAFDGVFAALTAAAIVTGIFALQRSEIRVGAGARRVARFVADYSFTLYLIHYTVLEIVLLRKDRSSGPVLLVLGVLASNVAAALLALPTEMRHRAFAKRVRRWIGAA